MSSEMEAKSVPALGEEILRIVCEANGLKDRELNFAVRKIYNNSFSDSTIEKVIEELVQLKKLISIEYSPDYSSVRTFYLPAKTNLIIRGQEEGTHRI